MSHRWLMALLLAIVLLASMEPASAQRRRSKNSKSADYSLPLDTVKPSQAWAESAWADSMKAEMDAEFMADSALFLEKLQGVEEPVKSKKKEKADTTHHMKRDWATWKPNPKRAMWLALVIPGGGQIYNRKYWKLPIIYGGFVGCAYAMRWNNMMYRDYSQAYLDIMDDDPLTQSYNQFLHLGNQVTTETTSRWQEIFRKRKDRYRRWRDMSFFVMVGVYAISVIDAYVDASLSEFDISPDLSMRVSPAVFGSSSATSGPVGIGRSAFSSSALGLQCSLNF